MSKCEHCNGTGQWTMPADKHHLETKHPCNHCDGTGEAMTPKKDEYMRGYADGFKDGMAHNGETGMVLGTGKERPLSIGLHTDGDPEARFESASLHQALALERKQKVAAVAALRSIAEGNLGDNPWQANYAKIRAVAIEAIAKAAS